MLERRIVRLSSCVFETFNTTAFAPETSAVRIANPRFVEYVTPSKNQIVPPRSSTCSKSPNGDLPTNASASACPFADILHKSLVEPSSNGMFCSWHNRRISEVFFSRSTRTISMFSLESRALRTASAPVICPAMNGRWPQSS